MSGKHYSPLSDHDFGDQRCRVDAGASCEKLVSEHGGAEDSRGRRAAVDRFIGFPPVPAQTHLLSFDEAKVAGEAIHDRWLAMAEMGVADVIPPLARSDLAWSDMARAAWEAVWASRRDRGKGGE